MRYHYIPNYDEKSRYGVTHSCSHPVYTKCTLYKIGNKGLSIIQQRYDNTNKNTYWTEIDPWLTNELYLHENFKQYFDHIAKEEENGIYPTVTIRKIMWALKMKPLHKEPWETTFDRQII